MIGGMRGRLVVWCTVLCSIALGCSTGSASSGGRPTRTLTNAQAGYTLTYPRGWEIGREVVATQFGAGAKCQSVVVVDSPADAGPADVRQSFVQLCWRPVTGGTSLAAYMRKTYRAQLPRLFRKTRLGGVRAYRTKGSTASRTFFVQGNGHRLQLVATVDTIPSRRLKRLAQVNRILRSFTLEH
jgi:predicted Zn-dependent protease